VLFGTVSALALLATVAMSQPASANTGSTVRSGDDIGIQTLLPGIDVSHWQGSINWTSVRNAGIRFAYIKATEGTSYKDPNFNTYYPAAYYAGVIRGAYHFARPSYSGGATQASYFFNNGGRWSADHRTLPGALDLEGSCAGLSQSAMRTWIYDFWARYKALSTRDVVIYTTASWWSTCTGGWTAQAARSPLWVAHWGVSSPTKPAGWSFYTFWQYTNCRSVSGISGCVDGDYFNGDSSRLLALADNTP